MKEYDFSKISDEELETAVRNHKEGSEDFSNICRTIDCEDCSFKGKSTEDCVVKAVEIRKAFKQELERRNKLKENERPELKAGMILDLEYRGKSMGLFLYINENWSIKLDDEYGFTRDLDEIRITKIYTRTPTNYDCMSNNLTLIWQATPPKTPQQQKIEELEETIKKATEQIEELKNANN